MPETVLAEYHETIYTGRSKIRRESSYFEKTRMPSEQRIYRDVNTIEENIDELRKGIVKTASSDLDVKIDKLLARKQKK